MNKEKSYLELIREFIDTSSAEVGERIFSNWSQIDSDTRALLFGTSLKLSRPEWDEIWATSPLNRGDKS